GVGLTVITTMAVGPTMSAPAKIIAAGLYPPARLMGERWKAPVDTSEIDAVRTLLSAKPRPVGWPARRARLDEVGSVWPVAQDIRLEEADLGAIKGEWSIAPGSDASRVLIFFHGGGYCSGSILSHRRMVTEAGRAGAIRTFAVGYRLAPEHPFPAAPDDAFAASRFLLRPPHPPPHLPLP